MNTLKLSSTPLNLSARVAAVLSGNMPEKRQFGSQCKQQKPVKLKNVKSKERSGFTELSVLGGQSGRIRACQMNPSKSWGLPEKQKSGATFAEIDYAEAEKRMMAHLMAPENGGIEVYQRLMMEHLANMIGEVV